MWHTAEMQTVLNRIKFRPYHIQQAEVQQCNVIDCSLMRLSACQIVVICRQMNDTYTNAG